MEEGKDMKNKGIERSLVETSYMYKPLHILASGVTVLSVVVRGPTPSTL